MIGKKKRIIETQAAIIEKQNKLIETQKALIKDLKEENFILNRIVHGKSYATDIDFPNSQKGGSNHKGAVNVSDILQS